MRVGCVTGDHTVPDGDNAVGVARQLVVMGDQHKGDAVVVRHVDEQAHDLQRGAAVQVAGRFVCKNDFWLCHKGSGNAHALLLAARHFRGLVPRPVA
ncbi:hypothetical protein DSECCO2_556940 [anaerobic digester metagenome]